MIFEYANCNYCIACDWLQYSVRLLEWKNVQFNCPAGYRIELLQGNNIFKNRAIVWTDTGEKMLTLLWSPYSRKLSSSLMTVQVANQYLYLSGIMPSFHLLQEIVSCVFNSMGRIDIAVDYELDDWRAKVIRSLYQKEYYVQGKKDGSDWWHDEKGGSFPHCLSWGSAKTEIKVKTYNKSRELGVSAEKIGEKPYISCQWRDAGFDVEKVWRLEFSMKSAGQLKWQGNPITLANVASSKWLLDMFCSLYSRRFIVRVKTEQRKGHKNEDDIVKLLNLPESNEIIRWKEGEKEVYTNNSRITAIRKVANMIDSEVCRPNKAIFEVMANTLYTLLDDKGMRSYFMKAYGADVDEWISERWEHCGGGIEEIVSGPNYDI